MPSSCPAGWPCPLVLIPPNVMPVSAHVQAKKCISSHLSTLADFAIEMFDVLDEINYQSYNDFVLRVGRCPQPLSRLRGWRLDPAPVELTGEGDSAGGTAWGCRDSSLWKWGASAVNLGGLRYSSSKTQKSLILL